MAIKKAPYSVKEKVWLPTMTMELEGGIVGVINSMFGSLPDDKRMFTLSKLNELHRSLSEKEQANKTQSN